MKWREEKRKTKYQNFLKEIPELRKVEKGEPYLSVFLKVDIVLSFDFEERSRLKFFILFRDMFELFFYYWLRYDLISFASLSIVLETNFLLV